MQPSLQLLDQAEKDIKHAKEYLKRLFVPTTVASSIPEFLSPIRECHGGRKCDDISSCVKVGSEAEVQHASEKPKIVYPKTPHPAASLKSPPQLSSTPLKEDQSNVQSPILTCSPRAIDFEESTLPDNKCNNVVARKKNSEVMESHKAKRVLPTEAGAREDNTATVSPGLPENENQRAELDDIHQELSVLQLTAIIYVLYCLAIKFSDVTELLQRPRRRCSSLNISYQEPSLNRYKKNAQCCIYSIIILCHAC